MVAAPQTGEIHLWHLDLRASARHEAQYWHVLDITERERADKAVTADLRRRKIVAPGALRLLLAHYLGIPPKAVRFERGSHGKPRLAGTAPDHGLVFNVSHSGDQALIAIGWDIALGVDLELQRPLQFLEAMAFRIFAPSERDYWQSLPAARRLPEFFNFWTAKEAFVKAIGRGIGLGLAGCVLAASGDDLRLIAVPDGCGAPEEWTLLRLNLDETLSAALCARTCQVDVQMLKLEHLWITQHMPAQ